MSKPRENWHMIVHLFRDFPRDSSTRCGLQAILVVTAVEPAVAARTDWGGGIDGLAICRRCAQGGAPLAIVS